MKKRKLFLRVLKNLKGLEEFIVPSAPGDEERIIRINAVNPSEKKLFQGYIIIEEEFPQLSICLDHSTLSIESSTTQLKVKNIFIKIKESLNDLVIENKDLRIIANFRENNSKS